MPEEEKVVDVQVEGKTGTISLVPVPEPSSEKAELAQAIQETADLNYMMKEAEFNHLQRVAKMFADSQLVPERFQGSVSDCAIALAMAWRHRADPMMFFNGIYVVHGRPGMEAKLAIALVNSQKVFTGPIQYKFEGRDLDRKCTAFATHRESGELCEASVSLQMAKAEGWMAAKKSMPSKWVTMPEVMLRYRAAIFLIRFYCPEALMGMSTADELSEISAQAVDVEVLEKQRQTIRDKVAAANARPALPEVAAEVVEEPLSETIANAPKVDETRPEDRPAEEQPAIETPAEEPPPQQTPEERKAERASLAALYVDLSEAAGETPQAITKLSTSKLKAECERLSAK